MKYTILTLDHPARDPYKEKIRTQMEGYEEVFVEGVNGRVEDSLNGAIDHYGFKINFNEWRPGEGGVWYSHINAWSYGADNDTDIMVFEDDAVLDKYFRHSVDRLNLPEDWDFVALYYPYWGGHQQNPFSIVPTIQEHGNVCVMYSANGCKKIMKMLDEEGLEWPVDIWLFKKSKFEGTLKGYGADPQARHIVTVDDKPPTTIHEGDRIMVHHPNKGEK